MLLNDLTNIPVVDTANSVTSAYKNLPKGKPGSQKDVTPHVSYNTAKAARIFGMGTNIPYCTATTTMKDCLSDFAARSWGL